MAVLLVSLLVLISISLVSFLCFAYAQIRHTPSQIKIVCVVWFGVVSIVLMILMGWITETGLYERM